MTDFPILSSLVFLPVLGAAAVALVPNRRSETLLPVGVAVSLLPLGAAAYLLEAFQSGEAGFQFVERAAWYEPWGISYFLGVDGISLLLVALTTLLVPLSLAASVSIQRRLKEFVVSLLLLEAALIGVFLSLDLFLFFLFWEAMLVPMYFIIGVWGYERRIYAAVKFFLYTAFGSTFMLGGILFLALQGQQQLGGLTFDFARLLELDIDRTAQLWLFAAFGLSFAIKVPLFPLHTWLPDAHVEAPTAGSVILAGVLLKLGTYGFLRFNLSLFPQATVSLVPVMAVLAVVGIIYAAAVAIVQPDLKRLVAYSSVSHLGFVVLGIFALTSQGLQGGVIQMVNHGLTTGGLFLLVGMISDRRHTREIAAFGGLSRVMPLYAGFFLFVTFGSIGLPGLNGFVGEFLVLLGSFLTLPVYAVVAAFGVVLSAVYLLWAYERMFTGPVDRPENERLLDLGVREVAILVPIALLVLGLGIYPKPALERIQPSVERVLDRIEASTGYRVAESGSARPVVEGG
ncbi:MAG: NADH-quinone oxidoreductase subunit M [Actinomycetota bacterium]|nr:NADH-quinone oxidoreductase subunit M [Actinomycetota bacterium]